MKRFVLGLVIGLMFGTVMTVWASDDLVSQIGELADTVANLVRRVEAIESMVNPENKILRAERLEIIDEDGTIHGTFQSVFGTAYLYLHTSINNRSMLINAFDNFVPRRMEWDLLHITARENSRGYLSDKLVKTSMHIYENFFATPRYTVVVDTETQPAWNVYLGNGRFSVTDREIRAAYNEAANYIVDRLLYGYFDRISRDNVRIVFHIRGSKVGEWVNGVMTLEGENHGL